MYVLYIVTMFVSTYIYLYKGAPTFGKIYLVCMRTKTLVEQHSYRARIANIPTIPTILVQLSFISAYIFIGSVTSL